MPAITSRQFFQTGVALLLSLVLAACGKQESPTTNTSTAATTKVYVVGTDAAYAPFELQNEKGEIVGFDIDVVKAIAKNAGFEVKFLDTPWEGIFNAVVQGDRDLLISSITITPERQQTLDFSAPYFNAKQLIAVKSDSSITSLTDLKKLKVGVQNGTTGDEVVTKLQGKSSANVKRFESTPLALKEMESGGVDAVVADNGVMIHYVNNNPNSKFKTLSDLSFTSEHYGIAVKKGNAELLALINKGLAGIQSDGTYKQIYISYFGVEPEVPGAAAAASN
ncbi:basic amino acid ABC transporter substrate-binding protein [Polaromonas sp.]|nr:basic amino acid ABC transporter substrate-binding protein [Polaromonas sp.]